MARPTAARSTKPRQKQIKRRAFCARAATKTRCPPPARRTRPKRTKRRTSSKSVRNPRAPKHPPKRTQNLKRPPHSKHPRRQGLRGPHGPAPVHGYLLAPAAPRALGLRDLRGLRRVRLDRQRAHRQRPARDPHELDRPQRPRLRRRRGRPRQALPLLPEPPRSRAAGRRGGTLLRGHGRSERGVARVVRVRLLREEVPRLLEGRRRRRDVLRGRRLRHLESLQVRGVRVVLRPSLQGRRGRGRRRRGVEQPRPLAGVIFGKKFSATKIL